jgi:hypothetical protein
MRRMQCLGNDEFSPAHESFTFPQAPLESRTVGFPESGSDLGPGKQKPSRNT